MENSTNPLTREFLDWVARRPRSYADAMEAWRSNCPRHPVWEDSLLNGLIRLEGNGAAQQSVTLTARGKAFLDANGG